MNEVFHKIAHKTSEIVGAPAAFLVALLLVFGWASVGAHFGYSDTWQLIINTGTTILTFLMVFLIQNTQNRDGRAIHLKLDELIRAQKSARNKLLDLEDLTDDEMNQFQDEFRGLREKAAQMEKNLLEHRQKKRQPEI